MYEHVALSVMKGKAPDCLPFILYAGAREVDAEVPWVVDISDALGSVIVLPDTQPGMFVVDVTFSVYVVALLLCLLFVAIAQAQIPVLNVADEVHADLMLPAHGQSEAASSSFQILSQVSNFKSVWFVV